MSKAYRKRIFTLAAESFPMVELTLAAGLATFARAVAVDSFPIGTADPAKIARCFSTGSTPGRGTRVPQGRQNRPLSNTPG
jgi:hypothetical protein